MTHAVVSIEECHNAAVSKIYSLQNVGTYFCGSGFDRETVRQRDRWKIEAAASKDWLQILTFTTLVLTRWTVGPLLGMTFYAWSVLEIFNYEALFVYVCQSQFICPQQDRMFVPQIDMLDIRARPIFGKI